MDDGKSPKDFLRTRGEYRDCPHCGCPNLSTDRFCSFCDGDLAGSPGLGTKMRRSLEQMKWRYKTRAFRKKSSQKIGTVLLLIVLGSALTSLGFYFMYTGAQGAGLTEFLFGLTFAGYGGYAIYKAFRPGGTD